MKSCKTLNLDQIYYLKKNHKDFWGFSKSVCTGQFGNEQINLTFDLSQTNIFYPSKYSVTQPLIIDSISWFLFILTRGQNSELRTQTFIYLTFRLSKNI